MQKNQDAALLIIRLAVGIMLLFHGIAKIINGVGEIQEMLSGKGIPGFIAYGVYIGEIIVPLMLIAGFRTRIASILLTINMLVIIFVAHAADILSISDHGAWKLELQGFYLFCTLALLFAGAGKYAVSTGSKWD